jgi:hypothetical protein
VGALGESVFGAAYPYFSRACLVLRMPHNVHSSTVFGLAAWQRFARHKLRPVVWLVASRASLRLHQGIAIARDGSTRG